MSSQENAQRANTPFESIPHRLLGQAKSNGDAPAYAVRTGDGTWTTTNWRTYAAESRAVAKALIAAGLESGQSLGILGYNKPEWTLMQLGAMMMNGLPFGIYATCSAEEVAYIINHSDSRIVLLENEEQWKKIVAERSNLPGLQRVILMKGARIDDPICMTWEDFIAGGESVEDAVVEERLSQIKPDGVGTLIYTSGTTGPPKGVMLTHDNLSWTAETAIFAANVSRDDRVLSYLPLSHIAEQMFTIHIPVSAGLCVYYARSMDTVPEDLREVRPTVFLAVPRVWEKMGAKIRTALDGASAVRKALAGWAMGVGHTVVGAKIQGKAPPFFAGLQHKLADRLVLSKVQDRLGLDQLKIAVSGAAPISSDLVEFFAGLGIAIHEVYGQSEGTGPTSFNRPGFTMWGTVGQPFPGTEVKIAEDGEILAKGRHIFAGYLKDDAATAETLQDGWLYSGDLGAFDATGHLKIVGRKKDIIITAGGKNIAPKNIEAALMDLQPISQAVLIGESRPYLTALLTLDAEAIENLRSDANVPAHEDPAVREAIQQMVDTKVNPRFARVEHVRKFLILPEEFSVEKGELTPSMKLKRKVVNQRFAPQIESLYSA